MKQTGDLVPQLNALFHVKGDLHFLKEPIELFVCVADMVTAVPGDLGGVPHLIQIRIKGA